MSLRRPHSGEGKTATVCLFAVVAVWLAYLAMIAVSSATGCVPNEGFAGTCLALGINWMPAFSLIASLIALSAFLASPVLLLVAVYNVIIAVVRRDW